MAVGPGEYPFTLLDTRPDDGHRAEDYTGFTRFQLELMERFRVVAVDYPMAHGNLSGEGAGSPLVEFHESGVPTVERMLTQYELPIVISVPTGIESEPATTAADTTSINVSVSAWVENYDRLYGMTDAGVIISNVVNNVEANRAMVLPEPHEQYGNDPLSDDVEFTGADFDFQINAGPDNVFLSWCSADFTIEAKRRVRY